jgi:hypothetical protein
VEPFLWAWILAAPLVIAVFDLMATGRAQAHHR